MSWVLGHSSTGCLIAMVVFIKCTIPAGETEYVWDFQNKMRDPFQSCKFLSHKPRDVSMMTSSNGKIFRVTDRLCEIPLTKANGAELWCFLSSAPGQTVHLRRHRAHYDVTVMSKWLEMSPYLIWHLVLRDYGKDKLPSDWVCLCGRKVDRSSHKLILAQYIYPCIIVVGVTSINPLWPDDMVRRPMSCSTLLAVIANNVDEKQLYNRLCLSVCFLSVFLFVFSPSVCPGFTV